MFFSTSLLAPILTGALLNLDKQVFGPFMVSRPLVVGFIIGLITDQLHYGIWLGLSAELLWLAALPLGGQLTPNPGLAVTAAFTAWLAVGSDFQLAVGSDFQSGEFYGEIYNEATLVIAFLTVPVWAKAFTVIDKISRKRAIVQLNQAREDLQADRNPHLFWRNFKGVGVTLVCSLVALLVAAIINSFFLQITMWLIPGFILWIFHFLVAFIPFLGLLGMAVFLEAKTFNLYIYGLIAGLLALSAV